jgi:3-oxoacyl-[acyl-carrier protein] reductase
VNHEIKEDEMSSNRAGLDRRAFLKAAGVAGAVAAGTGAGVSPAWAQDEKVDPHVRGPFAPWSNSKSGRRTAIITDTQLNIGPYLAREMARMQYDLVIGDVKEGLVDELKELGAHKVVVVPGLEQDGPNSEAKPGSHQKLVDAALKEFGGYDSVFIRTAIHTTNSILEETPEGLFKSYEQNCLAVMLALQATLPHLMEKGRGQVVVQTSATSEKPAPGLVAYSSFRAAAAMMCRCAALTAAPNGVCVNAVGTNFMNYPGFVETVGEEVAKKLKEEVIPMRRLGETREAAHFSLALLDGFNMYTTGNFFPIAGGFNNAGMPV